ncbi:unnamed protein product [Cylicocyclus nassatus]|uniref:MADF domain-containing protein n=1 Tax=Cylicocyclus nassatus TaxID=53992 RepID=A0AA36M141_CYLNA|nr:unnamed protein product [Cylicocyclus nassatus]
MDRKYKLAVISRVERHPEIWDFTCEDYKKQDVRLTAWDQIVSELQAEGFDTDLQSTKTTWKRLKDTFSKRLKHYPPGAAKAWVYDDDLQFLMSTSNSGADHSMTGPDEPESVPDVKPMQFDKEGSVTTEDGFTDASSVSVASPSTGGHRHRPSGVRRCLPTKKEVGRKGSSETPHTNGCSNENATPDRFDILGQYIAQTLRELSPDVSSMKILEITKVLHTPMPSAPNGNIKTTPSLKPSQATRKQ